MDLLFVYGSLKEGFPNFHVNRGVRVPGTYCTLQPHPLYVVGGRLPCLLPLPGQGLPVSGQLYRVDAAALAAMDRLERIGQPGGYHRARITVQRTDRPEPAPHEAFVYLQSPALLDGPGPHLGPLAEYLPEYAQTLRW
jgi:gamma-glutamylaminecyclotransferase